jgi:hypothetical protein
VVVYPLLGLKGGLENWTNVAVVGWEHVAFSEIAGRWNLPGAEESDEPNTTGGGEMSGPLFWSIAFRPLAAGFQGLEVVQSEIPFILVENHPFVIRHAGGEASVRELVFSGSDLGSSFEISVH